jgi:hypothetical protein
MAEKILFCGVCKNNTVHLKVEKILVCIACSCEYDWNTRKYVITSQAGMDAVNDYWNKETK